ncbi:hypothetical protein PIB30_029534 [Stylosanthes scabra]|uniref:Uncharacterized protein n=1 Tax=Stylosanthes scabra TaxID=79078 RepID=A0ABU6UB66_9FABA|nr:hypothetical protein [Stylosanthes scabra]
MQIGIQNELGNYKKEVQGLKKKQQELYNHYNNLYNYMKEKQKFLAKELDEIKRFQVGQTMMASSSTDPIEKLNMTMEEHRNEMIMIKRQLKEWTRNASHKDAYCCWARQQSNPNLTDIPTNRIPEIMQENAEKGRSIFYGFLKSDPEWKKPKEHENMDLEAELDAQAPKRPISPKGTQFQVPRRPSQCLGAQQQFQHQTSTILAPRRPTATPCT